MHSDSSANAQAEGRPPGAGSGSDALDGEPGAAPDCAHPLKDGRYRLLDVLGEGGMAVVYRGVDTRLRVPRAVKVLLPEMAARPSVRARFDAEARTMARLTHPHVVAIQDVGVDDDRPFLVMELLRGGTLWSWVLQHGSMPPRLAVDAILPVLDALSFAHQAGVVHRDVKPHNVLLTADGVPKLTDFGIARIDAELGRTRTAAVMGTWTYMPPEQRQSSKVADARSDVYAVGAMLVALVRGEDPPELFAADLDPSLLDGVHPALADVVRRATRYNPADRYPDALSMGHALLACRDALPEVPAHVATLGPMHAASKVPLSHALSGGLGSQPAHGNTTVNGGLGALTMPFGAPGLPLDAPGLPLDAPGPPREASLPAGTMVPPVSGTLAVDDEPPDGVVAPRSRRGLALGAALLVVAVGLVAVFWPRQPTLLAPPSLQTPSLQTPSLQTPSHQTASTPAAPQDDASFSQPRAPASPEPTPQAEVSTPLPGAASSTASSLAPPASSTQLASPPEQPGAAPSAEPLSEPVAVEPVAVEPVAVEPVAVEPVAVEPLSPKSDPEPIASEPASTDASVNGWKSTGPPGKVTVTGLVTDVRLISKANGSQYYAGEVPAGEYWLELRFLGGSEVQRVTSVRVIPGFAVKVRCQQRNHTCH